jgi:tagatose 1,6-diphosphate aldolase
MPNTAAKQLDTIREIAMSCIKYDIPFLVESVAYPAKAGKADPAGLHSKLVIETAKQITKLPIDVLKAEFPGDIAREPDENRLLGLCRELDAASQVPCVVLSAGVDFDTFARQVEIACKAGASGFLGGRAIWQEAMAISDRKERSEFLSTTVVSRIKKLASIVNTYAVPWYSKYGLNPDELADINMDWYKGY